MSKYVECFCGLSVGQLQSAGAEIFKGSADAGRIAGAAFTPIEIVVSDELDWTTFYT